MIASIAIADIANHAMNEPRLSLETATWWFDRAGYALIVALVVGAICTAAIVWLGIEKEHHWDLLRERANVEVGKANVAAAAAHERAAGLEKQAEEARGAIAEANARAAEAAQKAAEAQLALEKFRAPRSLSVEQRADIVSRMSKWATIPASGESQSVAVFSLDSSFESANLANQIAEVLGPQGAAWRMSRYPVMYGNSYSVTGVGMLTASNPRGIAVAKDLVAALTAHGIEAFVIPDKRRGCEEMGPEYQAQADSNPACSSISIIVGDKPK